MKIQIYSIFDNKAGVFMHPFFLRSAGEASRVMIKNVTDPDGPMSSFPEDYTLFKIGDWDDNAGVIVGHAAESLGNGVEFLKIHKDQQDRMAALTAEMYGKPPEEVQ